MIGTIANTCAILVGSFVGGTVRHGLKEKYQDILYVAMGLAATGLGVNAVVQNVADSAYPVLFIASLALGGVLGAELDLDGRFNRLVDKHSKGGDGGAPSLGRGLSTAIMLFCVGTLSILGPINSALYGDETFLFTNAMLDLVTSMVLASTFGFGIAIAAGVLFCWQGSIFLLASVLAPLLSGGLMCEISIVGGFLILVKGEYPFLFVSTDFALQGPWSNAKPMFPEAGVFSFSIPVPCGIGYATRLTLPIP